MITKPNNLVLMVALLAASCLSSVASVTLVFTTPALYRATNWLDGSGVSTTNMVWGIVVDAAGNGFRPGEYLPDFAYASGSPGISPPPYALQTESGATDDLLILSPNLMGTVNTPSDVASVGMNQITVLPSIPYSPGNLEGAKYRVIWFDQTVLSGTAQYGTQYGMFELPVLNTMPPDAQVINVASDFAGADAPKSMVYQLVPEPTAALLSAAGGISLLVRRKRQS